MLCGGKKVGWPSRIDLGPSHQTIPAHTHELYSVNCGRPQSEMGYLQLFSVNSASRRTVSKDSEHLVQVILNNDAALCVGLLSLTRPRYSSSPSDR